MEIKKSKYKKDQSPSQLSLSQTKVYKMLRILKGQLQTKYKLLSYERALKMPKNDMCITVIGQAVLEIFHFKVDIPRKVQEFQHKK